jgi:hypothetical protein
MPGPQTRGDLRVAFFFKIVPGGQTRRRGTLRVRAILKRRSDFLQLPEMPTGLKWAPSVPTFYMIWRPSMSLPPRLLSRGKSARPWEVINGHLKNRRLCLRFLRFDTPFRHSRNGVSHLRCPFIIFTGLIKTPTFGEGLIRF